MVSLARVFQNSQDLSSDEVKRTYYPTLGSLAVGLWGLTKNGAVTALHTPQNRSTGCGRVSAIEICGAPRP
jgi:hypothetical protein